MKDWTELLGHPRYTRPAAKLIVAREDALRRLLEVSRVSAHAAVRTEAMRIEQIDAILTVLSDEAKRSDDE